MRFLSVCSGIEAASVAWKPLSWKAAAFAEIDAFPSAVLSHHYPDTPNLGDMTRYQEWPDLAVDLICGGTPCQAFSVAGLRAGLADPRGNLALTFLGIVDRYRPRWVVWENVPGVLSSNGGRDLGSFVGGLGQLGYGWAYRVLDAQWCRVDGFPRAVPQRRRRVFVVGYLGDWRRAAAVLFEPESVLGDTPPRREAGERPSPTLSARTQGSGGLGTDFDCDGGLITTPQWPATITDGFEVCGTLSDGAHHGGGLNGQDAYTGRILPVAFHANAQADQLPSATRDTSVSDALTCSQNASVAYGYAVRRLTPRECERLMGFPDDYTLIPWRGKPAADGPRYKALGNSWAVNVARWVGRRIEMVEEMVP